MKFSILFSLLVVLLATSPSYAISGPTASTQIAAVASKTSASMPVALSKRESRRAIKQERKAMRKAVPRAGRDKSFVAAILLSVFLGGLGIDRFYLGRVGTGILKLITFGGFGIWYLVDIILIATRSLKPKNGEYYD